MAKRIQSEQGHSYLTYSDLEVETTILAQNVADVVTELQKCGRDRDARAVARSGEQISKRMEPRCR